MKRRIGNLENIIEKLKKDPGVQAKNIGKAVGLNDYSVRKTIHRIKGSEDPELRKLYAKRQAYLKGGNKLVSILQEKPGLSYHTLGRRLKEKGRNARIYPEKLEKLFKGLIDYCKKHKDKELRKIIIEHKKRGGWMP